MSEVMRIGTWNLDGRWFDITRQDPSPREQFLRNNACDVWLLTELGPKAIIASQMVAGYHCHVTKRKMNDVKKNQHWAAVLSRSVQKTLPDPHPASAAVVVGDITFCSSILPWNGCVPYWPWAGSGPAEKTKEAIAELISNLPESNLVWGGDWNHSFCGVETAGTNEGRTHIAKALQSFGLKVPTQLLPHQEAGGLSIDHIAVPQNWKVLSAERIPAAELSDHDAYVVEVQPV